MFQIEDIESLVSLDEAHSPGALENALFLSAEANKKRKQLSAAVLQLSEENLFLKFELMRLNFELQMAKGELGKKTNELNQIQTLLTLPYEKYELEHLSTVRKATPSPTFHQVVLDMFANHKSDGPVVYATENIISKFDLSDDQFDLSDDRKHFDSKIQREYFQQFLPHIQQEVWDSVQGQIELIKKRKLAPFTVQLSEQDRVIPDKDSEGISVMSGKVDSLSLPKLDHGFYEELVMITVGECKYFGVASIHGRAEDDDDEVEVEEVGEDDDETSHESEAGKAKKKWFRIEIRLLSTDSERIVEESKKANNQFYVHWLYGLIPDSRMFSVCQNPPPVQDLHMQIVRATLPAWPVPRINEKSDASNCLHLHKLNEHQQSVIRNLVEVENGLFFLQGPPGTGKTTTTVALALELWRAHPEHRMLLTAPSNQALRVLLGRIFEENRRNGMGINLALIGVGKNIPKEYEHIYVSRYAKVLYDPIIELRTKMFENSRAKELQSSSTFGKYRGEFIGLLDTIHEKLNHLLSTGFNRRVLNITQRHMFHRPTPKSEIEAINMIKLELADIEKELTDVPEEALKFQTLIDSFKQTINVLKKNKYFFERFLLRRADMIFATLVSSGRPGFRKMIQHFDTVLLDEAAQALVPAALIPLQFNPSLYIQIGDPMQLPATVTSERARLNGYENSMMHWLTEVHEQPKRMLPIQYRMHPDICKYISKQFYGNQLQSDESLSTRDSILQMNKKLPKEWQRPSLFFNISSGKENRIGGDSSTKSISNEKEARMIVQVVIFLLSCGFKVEDIGVISFYAAQIEKIQEILKKTGVLKPFELKRLAVNTVDGFQGGEKKIILVSMVRTSKSVGFLSDERRLNVALSRAQYARWVFGHFEQLNESKNSILPTFTAFHENDMEPGSIVSENALLAGLTPPPIHHPVVAAPSSKGKGSKLTKK